jgi:hypothetical protein
MSWNPNQYDPYSRPGPQQPYGGPGQHGHSAYGQGPYAQNPYGQQPKSGGGLKWLWILLGIGGVLFLACGGCCVAAVFFGSDLEEQELRARLEGNPVIAEHIGQIVSLETNMAKSFNEDDMNLFYYHIVGTVGEGELVVMQESGLHLDEDVTPIEWAKLRLASGEEFDVLP